MDDNSPENLCVGGLVHLSPAVRKFIKINMKKLLHYLVRNLTQEHKGGKNGVKINPCNGGTRPPRENHQFRKKNTKKPSPL